MTKNSLSFILLAVFLFIVTCSACDNGTTGAFKGMFVFGDDIGDNGNNNGLFTFYTKSNYLPYGVDFKEGPSGRFSNGKTIADCVADNLKLSYPPAFPDCSHKGTSILQGVNFASSGTGILGITGGVIIGIQHMDEQLSRFRNNILPKLKEQLGCSGQVILPNYLFVIGTGNNDYYLYYILKQYLLLSPEVFAAKILKNYFGYLKDLYGLGARKFLLISPYPIGCGPGLMKENKGCIKMINDATDIFHDQLLVMIKHSKQDMPDAQFSVLNSNKIIMDVVNNVTAAAAGITNVNCVCCETNLGDICKKAGKTCLNRKEYLYYDGIHLTEAANCYLASKAFNSTDTADVCPQNVQKLIPKAK